MLVINGWDIPCEIALIWMSLDFTDDKSTLVQVMAWCRQATSHYLSQCWPRSLSPHGVTRPQWVNSLSMDIGQHDICCLHIFNWINTMAADALAPQVINSQDIDFAGLDTKACPHAPGHVDLVPGHIIFAVTCPAGQVIFQYGHVLIFPTVYGGFTGLAQILAGHVKIFAGHVNFQNQVPNGHVNHMLKCQVLLCTVGVFHQDSEWLSAVQCPVIVTHDIINVQRT